MKKYFIGATLLLNSFIAPTAFSEESNSFYLSVGGVIAFPSDAEAD